MVYNGKSYQNGWFRGTPISGNHHLSIVSQLQLSPSNHPKWGVGIPVETTQSMTGDLGLVNIQRRLGDSSNFSGERRDICNHWSNEWQCLEDWKSLRKFCWVQEWMHRMYLNVSESLQTETSGIQENFYKSMWLWACRLTAEYNLRQACRRHSLWLFM